METPYRADNLIASPLEHYSPLFAAADPAEMAERTGTPLEGSTFHLTVLGSEKTVTHPDFADEGWNDRWRIRFMRFLLEGKNPGAPGGYKTYRDMPWGETYEAKFRQRCIQRLAGTYGFRPQVFQSACEAMGAVPVSGSGIGYEFTFLPGLFVRFILWEGDEEFPASAQILFSDNFPQAFSAEDRVVVCEYILGAMKAFS